MESLISTYGYLGVFLGTLLEGEATVLAASILAQQGYLKLNTVILVALIGTLIGDQIFYYLARWKGYDWACRSRRFRNSYPRASELLSRHAVWILISCRFLYGLRTVIPATCGVMRFPALRYSLLNLLSALLWTPLIALLGYGFGRSITAFFDGLYLQLAFFGPLLLILLSVWFFGWRAYRSEMTLLHLHRPRIFFRSRDSK